MCRKIKNNRVNLLTLFEKLHKREFLKFLMLIACNKKMRIK